VTKALESSHVGGTSYSTQLTFAPIRDVTGIANLPSENYVWRCVIKKEGIINRHPILEARISNLRFTVWDYRVNRATVQAPIQSISAAVISSRRISSGSSSRTYAGGFSTGLWNGNSRTVGWIRFVLTATGQVIYNLEIQDPQGVVRMVKMAQKSYNVAHSAAKPSKTKSTLSELERLEKLKEKGAITQDEFDALKRKLMEGV
jgi:hypothetical protein